MRLVKGRGAPLGALGGGLIAQLALVVSGPATARLLGVTDRGQLALLVIVATIASQAGAIGLPTAVAYTAARNRLPSVELLRVLAPAWAGLVAVAAGASAAVSYFVLGPYDRSQALWAAVLTAVFVASTMTWQLTLGCLQGDHRFHWMNGVRVISGVASAAVLISLLLVRHHTSVIAVFAVLGLARLLAAAIGAAAVLTHPSTPSAGRTVTAGTLARFGLAAMPAANAPLESLSLDQSVVGILLSRQQLGLYAVASAFNNLPSILLTALGTVALPRLSRERDPGARQRLLRRTALIAAALAGAATLFAEAVVGWLLPFAFGHAFSSAVPVARVLILAGFFLSLRRMLIVFLQALGRPGRTAIGEGLALVLLVIAAVILVPLFGIMGAGYALVFAAVIADLYLVRAISQAAAVGSSGGGADPASALSDAAPF